MAILVMLIWRVLDSGDGAIADRSSDSLGITTGSIERPVEPKPPSGKATKPTPIRLPYERETARLSDPSTEGTVETAPSTPQRFARVIVQDTGTVLAGKIIIRLSGLAPLALDARCEEGAGSWPCGRAGRSALRRLIRGRTIACEGIKRLSDDEVAGRCKVASVSINEWLVRHGWARPLDGQGEAMASALESARDEGRGQWRRKP